jgi:Flp pilus assembly pilin Flp
VPAKAIATLIAFGVPWLLLTAIVAVAVHVSPMPNGFLPFWMAVQAYQFLYFGVLCAVGLNTDSTGWHATAITAGNISVNFFIMALFTWPALMADAGGPTAVWHEAVLGLIAVALVGGLVAIGLGIAAYARRTHYL